MANEAEHRSKSASDVWRRRALMRSVVPAIVALALSEILVILVDPDAATGGWAAWLLWLLPVIPATWLVIAQMRGLHRPDEYERIQQLTAMAVGFATMVLLSLAGSLFVAAYEAGQTQWQQSTFVGGILAWVGALAVVTGRDR
jgi:hypothetical protein